MNEAFEAIIIHGSGGSAEENWFPWLATELKKRKCKVSVPNFPSPKEQSLESWLARFQAKAPKLRAQSVLFGHSTGAALALNLLQQRVEPISATFLVGGFVGSIGHPVYDPLNASFFQTDFNWAHIRKNAGAIFVYAGDKDPYVPLAKGVELAELLQCNLTVIPGGGHLNAESNYLRFDRLLADFDRWCERESEAEG